MGRCTSPAVEAFVLHHSMGFTVRHRNSASAEHAAQDLSANRALPYLCGLRSSHASQDLACLGFSADLVMQSFCHTAAYPKPVDVTMHRTLPKFIAERGGVALRPGDGIIHSWLNRMLLPDQAALEPPCLSVGGPWQQMTRSMPVTILHREAVGCLVRPVRLGRRPSSQRREAAMLRALQTLRCE